MFNFFFLLFPALESFGGQRLLQRADINVGSQITAFFRLRAKSAGRPGSEKGTDLRQLTYFGTCSAYENIDANTSLKLN